MPSFAAMVAVAIVAAGSEAVRIRTQITSMQAYEEFSRQFGVERTHPDAKSYFARVALFEQRREEVRRHNAQPGITWVAAVNRFADFTPSEFQAMLGHRPRGRASEASSSFLQTTWDPDLPTSVDWSLRVNDSQIAMAKDQGGCGSCWAVATAGALEMTAKIAGLPVPELSYEQLVDCTPNPYQCGGEGGCSGATIELAFEYVNAHGIAAKAGYQGYQSGGDGNCKPAFPVLTTTGYIQLAANKLQPLKEAVATYGPVAVSAGASSWGFYKSGVFDGCEKDVVVNHAILCTGYGTDASLNMDYWSIRNSWGPAYGENGYIRLLRHSEEDAYCGTDRRPLEGVGCKKGPFPSPATLPVCGMCGILSASARPTGIQFASR